jgi:hypothetical protein
MSTYFDLIMIPLQLLIVFFTIYYFTLSFFGLFGRAGTQHLLLGEHHRAALGFMMSKKLLL